MTKISEIQAKFAEFSRKYADKYPDFAWEYVKDNFFKMIGNEETPDILMQIYSELDITPSSAIFYHKHLKLLKDLFPIDGNIIEVGSGRIPAFANLLAQEQLKAGKGTITLYEPLLIELNPKYPNMTLNKKEFDSRTDVTGANLLVGICPCEATESILEKAIKSKIDFYVAMCGCVHSPYAYYFGYSYMSPEYYQEMVIDGAQKLIKENDFGSLEVTKFEDSPFDYPILYNRR